MSRPRLPPITFLPLVAAVVLAVLYGVRGHTDAETCANASDGKDKTHEPAAVGSKFGGRDYSSCGGGMLPERIEQAMSDIEDVFAAKGNDVYFGEPVTHLEHALQVRIRWLNKKKVVACFTRSKSLGGRVEALESGGVLSVIFFFHWTAPPPAPPTPSSSSF